MKDRASQDFLEIIRVYAAGARSACGFEKLEARD